MHKGTRTGLFVAAMPANSPICSPTKSPSKTAIPSATTSLLLSARDQGADACLGCFLTLLFILPGILYFYLYNRTARVTVAAYPRGSGSRVIVGGDESSTVHMLSNVIRGLPETPPERAAKDQAPVEQIDQPSGLAGKLFELNELKEAGLITPEEVEAKKKDLLDRM